MASTYSNLKIQLMATGENSGTWGNVTNENLGTAIEEAIVGSADVTFASSNVTLTLTDTNASQTARNLRLNLTGTTGGARDLIVPAIEKIYIVNNGCADTVTIKVAAQTGVAVPAGKTMYVYNNGTDCTDAITHLRNLTLATALPPSSGGTGLSSVGTSGNVLSSNGTAWESVALPASNNASALTIGTTAVNVGGTGANTLTAENVVIGNGTSAVKFVAPGTTGNVLTSNGSAWLSQAAAAGGGDYVMVAYTGPATWTKPAGLKAVKVTVVGGGGSGGAGGPSGSGCSGPGGNGGNGGGALKYIDAPTIPGPVTVTVGSAAGTSSFGPFVSATGGATGGNGTSNSAGAAGAGGTGSNGTVNLSGQPGGAIAGIPSGVSVTFAGSFGFGGAHNLQPVASTPPAKAGNEYGGGASGGASPNLLPFPPPPSSNGGTGAGGIVVVEEFY